MTYKIQISWTRCFHGGFKQTFVVQYSDDGLKWTNGTSIEGGLSTSKDRLNATQDSLKPNTLYYLRVFAYNKKGRSGFTTVKKKRTNNEGKCWNLNIIYLWFDALVFVIRWSPKTFQPIRTFVFSPDIVKHSQSVFRPSGRPFLFDHKQFHKTFWRFLLIWF